MAVMANTEALADLERLLCRRYNTGTELPGPFGPAVAAVRESGGGATEVEALAALVASREMYRWSEPIAAALESLRGEPAPAEDEGSNGPVNSLPPVTDLETMSFKDLQALAASRGLRNVGVSKAALIESLASGSPSP